MREIAVVKVNVRGKERWRVRAPRVLGGKDRYFKVRADADRHRLSLERNAASYGGAFLALPRDEQVGLMSLYEDYGSVQALRTCAAAGRSSVVKRITLQDAVRECLLSRKLLNVRACYYDQFERALGRFVDGMKGVTHLDQVTPDMISTWLAAQDWSPRTRKNHRCDVATLCNWAVEHDYIKSSPCKKVRNPIQDDKPPGILSVDDMALLLTRAQERDPGMVPFIACQAFGGVRASEVMRITREENIREGYIRLEGQHTKTRDRRLIQIDETLRAWLECPGSLAPKDTARRLCRLRQGFEGETVIEWPQRALRHSYCSYALPIHGATRTALQCGHSEAVLMKCYRELVTREEAERYFALRPNPVVVKPAADPEPVVVNQNAGEIADKAAGAPEDKELAQVTNVEQESHADTHPEAHAHRTAEEVVPQDVLPEPGENAAVNQDGGGPGAGEKE
jgi:site-specific recombinase XerC